MTKVVTMDEVSCEAVTRELPDLPGHLTERERLVALAALDADALGRETDDRVDMGFAVRVTRDGVLVLAWSDRCHEWAITIATSDPRADERRLLVALGMDEGDN